MPRSQALQIYMKPGLKEDDLMLRVWEACRKSGRPQHVFRTMLRAGLIAMVESGDMPESVIEECGLDSLVERRRKRVSRHSPASQQTPIADPYSNPYPPQARYAHPSYAASYPEQPVYAPPPNQAPLQAQPRYYEEERRPAPPVEMPPPRHEEPPVPVRSAPPESVETRPVQANPSTSEDGAKPQRKLGKLM
jgi:hypothetical protein